MTKWLDAAVMVFVGMAFGAMIMGGAALAYIGGPVEEATPDFDRTYQSSVEIVTAMTTSSGQTYRRAHCSGVHLGDGRVLTAAHCVRNQDVTKLEVDGFQVFRALEVNPDLDYAVLQVPDLVGTPASPMSCEPLQLFQQLILVSEPQGFDNIYTYATVSSDVRPFAQWKFVQFVQGTAAPGSSGGPLYREDGTVAGILVGGFTPFGGTFLIVPAYSICSKPAA